MQVSIYFTDSELLRQIRNLADEIGSNILVSSLPTGFLADVDADQYWTDSIEFFHKHQFIDTEKFVLITKNDLSTADRTALREAKVVDRLSAEMLLPMFQDQERAARLHAKLQDEGNDSLSEDSVSELLGEADVTDELLLGSYGLLPPEPSDDIDLVGMFKQLFVQSGLQDAETKADTAELSRLETLIGEDTPSVMVETELGEFSDIEIRDEFSKLIDTEEQFESEPVEAQAVSEEVQKKYEQQLDSAIGESLTISGTESRVEVTRTEKTSGIAETETESENSCPISGVDQLSSEVEEAAEVELDLSALRDKAAEFVAPVIPRIVPTIKQTAAPEVSQGADGEVEGEADAEYYSLVSKSVIQDAGLDKDFDLAPVTVSLPAEDELPKIDDSFVEIAPDTSEFTIEGKETSVTELSVLDIPCLIQDEPGLDLTSLKMKEQGREQVQPNDTPSIPRQGSVASPSRPQIVPNQMIVPRVTGPRGSVAQSIAMVSEANRKALGASGFKPKMGSVERLPKTKEETQRIVNRRTRIQGKCYLFGSAARKAGASTMAYNFASECSKVQGERVCLIDLDLSSSRMSLNVYTENRYSFEDSSGIENVLNISGQEYLNNLDIFTSNVSGASGSSFSFIRCSPAYPFQVKKLLMQTNFVKLLQCLQQVYDVVVVDIGNFQELSKYKVDLLKGGFRNIVVMNCLSSKTVLDSTQVCNKIPVMYGIALGRYQLAVSPIEVSTKLHRRVLGSISNSQAVATSSGFCILSEVSQHNINVDWITLVNNLKSM